MSKSVPKSSPASSEEARTWFVEHFSACADLDTRLIPDLHAGGPGEMKRVECPIAFGAKDLDALRQRFSCDADILLTSAFGVTVSAFTPAFPAVKLVSSENGKLFVVLPENSENRIQFVVPMDNYFRQYIDKTLVERYFKLKSALNNNATKGNDPNVSKNCNYL